MSISLKTSCVNISLFGLLFGVFNATYANSPVSYSNVNHADYQAASALSGDSNQSKQVSAEESALNLAQIDSVSQLRLSQYNQLSPNAQAAYAKQWHLSVSDFKDYLHIKNNTPTGLLYGEVKQDPNYLIALQALADNDKMKAYRYMEQAVINEHKTTEDLLAAQNMFQRMSQRLYPNETPIKLSGQRPADYVTYGNPSQSVMNKFAVLSDNTSYVLMVDASKPDLSKASKLDDFITQMLKKQNTHLDIYDTSYSNTSTLVDWAQSMGISSSLVNGGVITINRTGEVVRQLKASIKEKLPSTALLKNNNGKYMLIDWQNVG